ncbi:MAG: putative quinol monooxygenase [Solirubrobacterales bacterium]
MYGLIGKINAVEGERDRLIELLLEGSGSMPGCLSYLVARDPEDPAGIWVTEVWESQEDHRASLELPQVTDTIARARPLIAGFSEQREIEPVGGHGLVGSS